MYRSIRTTTSTARPDAIVHFIFSDGKPSADLTSIDDRDYGGAIARALASGSRRGDSGRVTVVPPLKKGGASAVVVGLGEAKSLNGNTLRSAGAALGRSLDSLAAGSATLETPAHKAMTMKAAEIGSALGEGIGLGCFSFTAFKKSTLKDEKARTLALRGSHKVLTDGLKRGLAFAESANFCRTLAATPPNIATTTGIAQEAMKLARKSSAVKCRVLKGEVIRKHRFVGLENVGKASENAPCMIELTYTPPRAGKSAATVLLVGKTICYDTGGLSLKISNGMKGMKYDKNGGMAVLGAMHAIATGAVKPRCKVVALLPAAENSISDEAYRPDDIIEYPNGVFVEVTNTDAEGRLVLADALVFGEKTHKPDAIIDLATLTGGVVVALGDICAGLFCNDDKLRGKVEAAAEASGEAVWRLPLNEEYREMMKSKHADIWNSAPVRHAHPIQGAAFLSYFVGKTPWAHLDIAGVSALDRDKGPFPAGPTGFGVRLLANLLENW